MSDLGLPRRSRVRQLLFNPVAGALIALIQARGGENSPVSRLYWRKKSERRYRQLGKPKANVSYDSPAVAASTPFLFFNVTKYTKLNPSVVVGARKLQPRQLWAGDWVGVYQADLRNGTVRTVLEQETLRQLTGAHRAWITNLVAGWRDGRGLYCVVGLLAGPGTQGQGGVDYYLCGIDLVRRRLTKISRLEGKDAVT